MLKTYVYNFIYYKTRGSISRLRTNYKSFLFNNRYTKNAYEKFLYRRYKASIKRSPLKDPLPKAAQENPYIKDFYMYRHTEEFRKHSAWIRVKNARLFYSSVSKSYEEVQADYYKLLIFLSPSDRELLPLSLYKPGVKPGDLSTVDTIISSQLVAKEWLIVLVLKRLKRDIIQTFSSIDVAKLYYKLLMLFDKSDQHIAGIKIPSDKYSSLTRAKIILNSTTFDSSKEIYNALENAKIHILPEAALQKYAGKTVIRKKTESGKPVIVEVSDEYATEADIIISLGLDTANDEKSASAGIRSLNQMLYGVSESDELPTQHKEVMLWPSQDQYSRYQSGILYYYNDGYFNEDAIKFVDKHMIPRIFKCKNVPAEFKPILLLGYSLGARMNIMVVNAFKYQMIEMLGFTGYDANEYIKKIFRLNVGAAVNWFTESHLPSPSLTFISSTDMGVLKPKHLLHNVFFNEKIHHNNYIILNRPQACSPEEFLVVSRPGLFAGSHIDKGKLKASPLGHSLTHYAEGIQNSEMHRLLKLPKLFIDPKLNNFYPLFARKMRANSTSYDPNRRASRAEIDELEKSWATYIDNESKISRLVSR